MILAVAGAGKTYYICHKIDANKKNLILAFTNENIYNIKRELCHAHGRVPDLTTVMTFDSFVYRFLIRPYEPYIAHFFGEPKFISKGICTEPPPPKVIELGKGNYIPNFQYQKKDNLRHYVTRQNRYYCATLSELVMQVKNKGDSLIKRASLNLNRFFDCVMIDEFQDFREYDYDLIVGMAKYLENIILVGDYFQHSVSATNNTGKPFKKKKKDVSYEDFITEIQKHGFKVDTTTLKKSRRCSPAVCQYITQKLGIYIESENISKGNVIWADSDANEILEDDSIVKLVLKDASQYSFRSVNWSYSKGDTVDAACVILTRNFEKLEENDFSVHDIPISTLNKLYVAMTRSRGDLYLIRQSTFSKFKEQYICK